MANLIFYSALTLLGLWCWDAVEDAFDRAVLGSTIFLNAAAAVLALWELL